MKAVEAEKVTGLLPPVQVKSGARAAAPEPGVPKELADVSEGRLRRGCRLRAGRCVALSRGMSGFCVLGTLRLLGTLQRLTEIGPR